MSLSASRKNKKKKKTKDDPIEVGDRIMIPGRYGRGVVATLLARPGWVEVVWDDGSDQPMICHQNKLVRTDIFDPN